MEKDKLIGYAKTSDIMNVKVQYNKEVFSFNLDSELMIVESKLHSQVKGHVRSYAFLSMLYNKLKIKYKDQQKKVKRMKDGYFAQYSGKFKSVTEGEAIMYKNHKELKAAEDELLQIEELRDTIEVCVRTFEQRKDMLQTLSANLRIENKNPN